MKEKNNCCTTDPDERCICKNLLQEYSNIARMYILNGTMGSEAHLRALNAVREIVKVRKYT